MRHNDQRDACGERMPAQGSAAIAPIECTGLEQTPSPGRHRVATGPNRATATAPRQKRGRSGERALLQLVIPCRNHKCRDDLIVGGRNHVSGISSPLMSATHASSPAAFTAA